MKDLGRLITAMVTPFDENGAVDYNQAKKLALALLNSGSDGLVVVGTTGESPTLVRSEELRLFREIKAVVGRKGSVIAGTGSNSTAEALEATREAEKVGVDACLLVVPYYNKPTQEGLYQHFKKIANSTSLPCILYNVPSRTITSLTAETVIKLSQVKNIIGIKEASGNFEQIARILSRVRGADRVGVCLDTAHAFAAGYDLRTTEAFSATLAEFDRIVGIRYLKGVHLNDSKAEMESRVDRHAPIGKGKIGMEAFRFIMNDRRFEGIPLILETPESERWVEEIALLYGSIRKEL